MRFILVLASRHVCLFYQNVTSAWFMSGVNKGIPEIRRENPGVKCRGSTEDGLGIEDSALGTYNC